MPPIAPAGSRMRARPVSAAPFSRARSFGSASAPTEITRQSTPPRSTASPCSATAPCPATSATTAGPRSSSSASVSTMSIAPSLARAFALRPGRASAPTIDTPLAGAARSAATTSCAMPPQPMRPTAVMATASLRQPHAGELPLRLLLHGVAHALASEARRADTTKGRRVEPEAAGGVDPERADPQLARHLERGFEIAGEAGALQAELRGIGERQRSGDVGDALHHHHRAERLLAHQPRFARRIGHDRRPEDRALALGLEHQAGALGDRIVDHLLYAVGGGE